MIRKLWGHCPQVAARYQNAVSIPMHPTMTDDAQTQVIQAFQEVLE